MASRFTKTATASSDNSSSRRSDDPGGGEGGGGGEERSKSKEGQQEEMKTAENEENFSHPWQVVKNEILHLVRSLDMTLLRSSLYSASLIDYDEYCFLNLGTKTKPEHAEDLLTTFIERGNPEEFDRFLRAMKSVEKYFPIARDLKTKAEKEAQNSQGKQTSKKSASSDAVGSAASSGKDAKGSPWQVVKNEFFERLSNSLDVTELKGSLWSANLISYKEYCNLQLSTKAGPDHAEHLLTGLINVGDEQQFYRFLGVLESVPACRKVALDLKKKVGEQARDSGSGSHICQFVVVRRVAGQLCDLAVDGKAIDKINGWDIVNIKDKQQERAEDNNLGKDKKDSVEMGHLVLSTNTTEPRSDFGDPDLLKSKMLLSDKVELPAECRDKGDARVVVLAGDVSEIVSWLRENTIVTEEEELGKILHSSVGEDVSATGRTDGKSVDAVATSGIFCVLPQFGNTLYVVVRLRWMDEQEVQFRLLRIALEMSPMWLIFYSRDGIEQNGFCIEAYHEPDMPDGDYFLETSNDAQKTADSLVNQLREVINRYPYGNNLVQPLSVLHIEYIFDVSLPFFSSNMVYHNPLDSQAKCTVLTYEKFAVQSDSRTKNAEIAQIQQGIPDLTVGVSLRRKLKKSLVEGYPVDLRWWLQMSSCYVEVAMLSCCSDHAESSSLTAAVCCTPFPKAQVNQYMVAERVRSGTGIESQDNAACLLPTVPQHVCEVSDMVTSTSYASADTEQASSDNFAFTREGDGSSNCQQQWGTELEVKSSGQNPDESLSQRVAKDIRHAMEAMNLPPSLTNTFMKWLGPVQTLVCVAADMQRACIFLNKLTGSNLGLFAGDKLFGVSAEAASESSSPISSTTHSHFPASRVWMCCRPSDAVLYVLMCFDGLSLAAAACPNGFQESASLVTAAALANIFIVLTDSFPQNTDILESLLLPGLQHFGKRLPGRGKNREEQLFNSVLVPVVMPADFNHKCMRNNEGTESCPRCTKHFHQICKKKSWKAYAEQLKCYFVGVQPICSKTPHRTVAKLLFESRLCHRSGQHFQQMLQLTVAAAKVQGQGDAKQLEHLLIRNVMQGEWIQFEHNLQDALTHGMVKGDLLPGSQEEEPGQFVVTIETVRAKFQTTLEFGLLEENQYGEVRYSDGQGKAVQVVLEKSARALCTATQVGKEKSSYKCIAPDDIMRFLRQALQQLIACRKKICSDWWEKAIKTEPFNKSDGARNYCKDLVKKFGEQWQVCEKRCQFVAKNGEKCLYHCLLPEKHSKDQLHSCLDPRGEHDCENDCGLCEMEKDSFSKPCIKPAGHNHTGNYETKLHMCHQPHFCPRDCQFQAARNCTVWQTDESRPGKCKHRIDHHRVDNSECICTVSRHLHLCTIPCALKENPGCKGGLCNNVYDQHNGKPHLCGSEHDCIGWCSLPGVCMRDKSNGPNRWDDRELLEGKDGWRLRCSYGKILANQDKHGGSCNCGREHSCEKRCPFCKCYCKNPYGHHGLCDVEHGEICGEMEVYSNIDKKVIPGRDSGLRCDQICLRAGNGHEHHESYGNQQTECVLHDNFWKNYNLEDPYELSDIERFCRCPEKCKHSDHSGSEPPVYCTERLNHNALSPSSVNTTKFHGKGYISHTRNGVPDGHHFECARHTCGYSGTLCETISSCREPCTVDLGHTGLCSCGDPHECGRKCAANRCEGSCKRLSEPKHDPQDCSCKNGGCTEDCELCDPPKKRCCSTNHLHRPSDGKKHYCEQKHPCKGAMCEKRGICALASPNKTPEHAVFERKGLNGLWLKCAVKRPKGKSHHEGQHSCGEDHTCDKKCPFCDYYCERTIGHSGDCKTTHGPAKNLKTTQIITAEGQEKSLIGTVTCDKLCDEAGRGHLHILKCNCTYSFLGSRNEQTGRWHHTNTEDLALHSQFWKSATPSFSDPASVKERREFELCGVLCPWCKTDEKMVECLEAVRHKPIERKGYFGLHFIGPKSHAASYGHRFPCKGHMCQKTCTKSWWVRIRGNNPCGEPCNGTSGHTEKCHCEKHWNLCGENCAAPGCQDTCEFSKDGGHPTHKCDKSNCMQMCEFDGCTTVCSLGHIHPLAGGVEEFSHHCGKTHNCDGMCSSKGACTREPSQAHSSSNGFKKQCTIPIPIGKKKHEGDCSCGTEKRKHTCPVLCPLCQKICKKDVDHRGLHDYNHGHVRANSQVLTSYGAPVEAGRSCSDLCRAAGRGHTHPNLSGVDSRWEPTKISPRGTQVLHSYFWSQQWITDPLLNDSLQYSMDGCPVKCNGEKHYCTGLYPWHPDNLEVVKNGSSKKCSSGLQIDAVEHYFKCQCQPLAKQGRAGK